MLFIVFFAAVQDVSKKCTPFQIIAITFVALQCAGHFISYADLNASFKYLSLSCVFVHTKEVILKSHVQKTSCFHALINSRNYTAVKLLQHVQVPVNLNLKGCTFFRYIRLV